MKTQKQHGFYRKMESTCLHICEHEYARRQATKVQLRAALDYARDNTHQNTALVAAELDRRG